MHKKKKKKNMSKDDFFQRGLIILLMKIKASTYHESKATLLIYRFRHTPLGKWHTFHMDHF